VRKRKWRVALLVVGGTIVLPFVAVAVLGLFYARFRHPTGSMYPTIEMGRVIWVRRNPYGQPSDVKRGDVVGFLLPEDRGVTMLKRVVGVPGDTVSVAAGRLSVGGRAVRGAPVRTEGDVEIVREHLETATYEVALGGGGVCTHPPVTITLKDGEFFVLGDNRCNSRDSRHFGAVPFELITGRLARLE
jgi:signal peptidase I